MRRDCEQTEHRRTGKRKKAVLGFILYLAAGLLALYMGITKFTTKAPDTEEGLKAIRELENADVATVEKKIDDLQKASKHRRSDDSEVPVTVKFRDAVVMGDSIASGLSVYEVLNEENVVADIGISIDAADDAVSRAAGLNPKYVFLAYGENDVEATGGNAEIFGRQYRVLLDKVKTAMPEAKIYVNGILPVKQKEIDRQPFYAELPSYNEELKTICEEENLPFIDNTSLVKEEFYEPDGVHMGMEYYPLWTAHMAEVAGL